METKTKRSKDQNTAILAERFGVADSKGREIGGHAQTFEVDFSIIPEAEFTGSYYTQEPGHYFGFRPSATRNGRCFGALQRVQLFLTAGARDAAVEKYFRNARKRAEKTAAAAVSTAVKSGHPASVACEECHASAGEDCILGANRPGRKLAYHPSRVEAAAK